MQRITPSRNKYSWPRHRVETLELRSRDLTIRIADWTRDRDAPGYDVEVYIGGVYDWHASPTVNTRDEAVQVAQQRIADLL